MTLVLMCNATQEVNIIISSIFFILKTFQIGYDECIINPCEKM